MNARKPDSASALQGRGELLSLPGMDAARAETLLIRLHVRSRADLRRALAAGKVVGLPGFSRELKSRLQAALAAEPAQADPAAH